ncbi:chaperone protein TorD [Halalkaliarchaeum desulfuricum]|uniref:Chaperone protein TorD n=2 Tax=Halalkaliarchaeum desulfuricum TaxID=2055893 RepID=A0A343TMT9_9EURY|nr:chaperone protein TorD [Halalkaliarchaeum desulfuricum]
MATDDTQSIAELYALLSTCFQTPDRALVEAARTGTLYEQLVARTGSLGFRPERPPTDGFEGVPDLHEAYLRSFEGFEGAYAPPAESAYEQWWDGRDGGLLSGPAAVDMRRRFDAVEVDIPDRYPADHIALLLEYGGLLLEAAEIDAYVSFHEEHFDWIPDFHERVEETCEDPFYVWTVQVLSGTIEAVETQLLRTDQPDEHDG